MRVAALVMALAVAGCATAPEPVVREGPRQSFRIAAYEAGPSILQSSGIGGAFPGEHDRAIEAECTASNDLGSWTVTTPGQLDVPITPEPLKITCRREGYRVASASLKCASQGARTAVAGMWGLSMVFPPLALVALPVVGVMAASRSDAATCTYGPVEVLNVWMAPK